MQYEEIPRPVPGAGQALVRVKAAGVGPWDAWVRSGKSVLPQPLPLTLGSDLSGVVESVGPQVSEFRRGDEVYGVTNARFTGAYAQYALAEANMVAPKPASLSHVEAASLPVVATTAWQMLFDHAGVGAGKRVLVHGAAGNVGGWAVRLATQVGAEVFATVRGRDAEYVRELGANHVIDVKSARFEDHASNIDAVIDTVGGETLARSCATLKPGGTLVSAVAEPDPAAAARHSVTASFMLVSVTTDYLKRISKAIESGRLRPTVGETPPLVEAKLAHEMLDGKPHRRGKIVLLVEAA